MPLVYMYICIMYVCMYVCMYACMHACVCVCVFMYVFIYVLCTYVYMYLYTCVIFLLCNMKLNEVVGEDPKVRLTTVVQPLEDLGFMFLITDKLHLS